MLFSIIGTIVKKQGTFPSQPAKAGCLSEKIPHKPVSGQPQKKNKQIIPNQLSIQRHFTLAAKTTANT